MREINVKIDIKNMVPGGDFESGIPNGVSASTNLFSVWEVSSETVKFGENALKIQIGTTSSSNNQLAMFTFEAQPGHVYYYSGWFEAQNAHSYPRITISPSNSWDWLSTMNGVAGQSGWQYLSSRYANTTYTGLKVRWSYSPNATVGDTYHLDGLMIIDLTETFGKGSEPSKEWCDNNIPFVNDELIFCRTVHLITDRSQSDITSQEALEARIKDGTATAAEVGAYYLGKSKGSYNATDLNRVGEVISYLARLLSQYSYTVTVSPKIDWAKNDIPTPEQLSHYLDQVQAIRNVLPVFSSTQTVPEDISEDMTLEEANDIEKILSDVDTLINNMIAAFYYCGEVYSGEI